MTLVLSRARTSDCAELILEPGQDVFATQGIRLAEYGFAPVGAVHARNDAEGVNHPYRAGSRIQPVANLRQYLTGPIIWR
jgi:hypothetical protein